MEKIIFNVLPKSLAELKALPAAGLTSAEEVAALTVAALCCYPANPQEAISMLNYLKGPQPLTPYEVQFLRDRFRDKDYVPRSFFVGAVPQNNYTPAAPYTIQTVDNPHSGDQLNEGYYSVYLRSGGADSPRSVKLRKKPSTGQWFLWEQLLLADIRIPVSDDPWA